jgi:hypothetical protein
VLALLAISGCISLSASSETSSSQVQLRDLLLETSVYPLGWAQNGVISNAEYAGGDTENIGIAFRYRSEETSVSIHTVLRYESHDAAQNGFDALLNHDKVLYQDLAQLKELSYNSQVAQRTSLLCSRRIYSVSSLPPLCIALAQYGSYISMFSSPIDIHAMSDADFMRILSDIDKKMTVVANE